MKNFICNIIYAIIIIGIPMLFTLNGLDITTWQWWALFGSICVAHVVGIIKGMDEQ